MPVPDAEALQKILRELLQVVQEIRAIVPSNSTSPDAPKVPGRDNVIALPPAKKAGPNDLLLPHPPGSAKECALCEAYMANVVFYPCMHCVICSNCWRNFYALSGKDGKTSAFARPNNRGCPVKTCRMKIEKAFTLSQWTDKNRENEVKYSQKNEYLCDSAALV